MGELWFRVRRRAERVAWRLVAVAAALAAHPRVRPALRRASAVAKAVSPLGRIVAGTGATAVLIGWWYGWQELIVIAAACLILFVLAVRYTLGRAQLSVAFSVPTRVTVGDEDEPGSGAVTGTISVRNVSHRSLSALRVELPVAGAVKWFTLPRLAPGKAHDERFAIPTARRGVFPVGPATSVRGDPLGLLRRAAAWTGSAEVIVHPVTVPLATLGAGLQRDLEGQTTNDLSTNDVAFHALREYVPGDDLRHVHAMTSARTGRLMVRQFVDTRTAHLTVLVSGARWEYRDEDEFEVAISVAASVALRGLDDRQKVDVVAAGHHAAVPPRARRLALDSFSRARFGASNSDLLHLAARTQHEVPATTLAVLVTGSQVPLADLRLPAARFSPDVRVVCVHVATGAQRRVRRAGSLTVVTIGSLESLRTGMREVARR